MRMKMATAASARRASARSAARLVAAPLVALLIMVVCNNAYAEVDWHEKGANMSATVSPWSYPEGRAYALSEFLGYDWGSLSTDVRDKILTDSNGDNAFKALLDHNVLNVQYESGDGALNWPIINLWSTVFGLDKCWDISTTNERYTAARELMKKYMFPNDGDTGGGESGGESGGDITVNSDYVLVYNAGKKYADSYNLVLSDSAKAAVENVLSKIDNPGCFFWAGIYRLSSNNKLILVAYSKNNVEEVEEDGVKKIKNKGNGTYTFQQRSCSFTLVDGTFNCSSVSGSGTASINTDPIAYQYVTPFFGDGGDGGGGGDEPYVPVPKEDPTRPVVQIGDVTVDLSNGPYTVNNTTYSVVYSPDNSWSIQVETPHDKDYSGDIVATETTDYSGVLDAILRAINAFRQEVLGYYNDIDADLTTLTNSLNGSLKNVETTLDADIKNMRDQLHADIGTLQDNLQSNFNGKMDSFATDLWANIAALDSDLIQEIYKDAKYIVDNLNFNADFDDSGMINWLKKIYMKLRSGPSGIRDPTEDPKGWFDDLEDVLRKLLDGFLTGFNTAELTSLMDQLKDRFPISIPWDVLAMIKLFEGEAVTPSVDWPIYNGDTLITEIQMDFSIFDNVAAITRKLSLVAFAMVLAVNTKFLMNTTTTVTRRIGGGE